MDRDCVFGFIEQHTVITDSKPEESLELVVEWFDPARASLGVAMDGFKDVQCGFCSIARTSSGTLGRKRIFFTLLLNRPCRCELGPW
jgi:hypothetical protein